MNKIEKIKQELKTKYKESLELLELIENDVNSYEYSFYNSLEYIVAKINLQEYSQNSPNFKSTYYTAEKATEIIKEYDKIYPIYMTREDSKKFIEKYLSWFFPVSNSIKFLFPEKFDEFNNCYYNYLKTNNRTPDNYKISNYINNDKIDINTNFKYYDENIRIKIVYNNFNHQRLIVKAIIDNFDSVSFNYEKETYMTFQEENIDSVQELFDNNFLRAAGALCGVIIEKHLKTKLLPFDKNAFTSKNLTLEPLNQACKKNNIYTTTEFKKIIHLTDLRNLCDHKNTKDPTKDQVQELIDGTKWIIYNI